VSHVARVSNRSHSIEPHRFLHFRAPYGVPVSAKGGESIVSFTDLYTYLRARFVREEGQTMAEYGVVLAVIALTVIVAFTALSGGISNAINNVTHVLNG
jgi:Flp pilus assembly pilin Flp